MSLEIIGPGFGRTGTMSLKAALERLGFAPCYHMIETYARDGVEQWTAVINGAAPDWDVIFAGYRAVVDWPACSYWKQIKAAYPNAKVILTRRDPDAWYESMRNTIFQALRATSDDERLNGWRAQTRKLIFEQTFGGDLGHDNAVAVKRAHEEHVIDSCAPGELLVYEVGDGWEPLCTFLGVAVPDEPFPRTNSTAEFRAWTGLDHA